MPKSVSLPSVDICKQICATIGSINLSAAKERLRSLGQDSIIELALLSLQTRPDMWAQRRKYKGPIPGCWTYEFSTGFSQAILLVVNGQTGQIIFCTFGYAVITLTKKGWKNIYRKKITGAALQTILENSDYPGVREWALQSRPLTPVSLK